MESPAIRWARIRAHGMVCRNPIYGKGRACGAPATYAVDGNYAVRFYVCGNHARTYQENPHYTVKPLLRYI